MRTPSNPRASQVVTPDDLPNLAVVLAAWHRADDADDRIDQQRMRAHREDRDRKLIARARTGTLRHISQ